MKHFHLKRLLKLADHLERVPHKQFCLKTWMEKDACNTVACACGHACSIRSFRRAGLRLVPALDLTNEEFRSFELEFNGKSGFGAAKDFFGVSYHAAQRLFHPDSYQQVSPTPKVVAKRIRQFVKEHQQRC